MASPETAVPSNRRWYAPTPGKFVALLLLSVVALYLSDQYDWFAFNKQKGWTVLIAAATVAAGFALLVGWATCAYLLGQRAQFGLATLLLMIAAVAAPCAWFTHEVRDARQMAEDIEQIKRNGGSAYFFYMPLLGEDSLRSREDSFGNTPRWLRRFLGDEFFGEIRSVNLEQAIDATLLSRFEHLQGVAVDEKTVVADEFLSALADLPELEGIIIFRSEITDAGLKHLQNIRLLKEVLIFHSRVTVKGRDSFEQTFAGECLIAVDYDLEFKDFELAKEADPGPVYDSPYTLEYRAGPSPRARVEDLKKSGSHRLPGGPIDLPGDMRPDSISPEAPEQSALEDLLEI